MFIRNANPQKADPFTYLGVVKPIIVRGINPVNIIWQVGYSDVSFIEKDELEMEKEFIDYKNDLFSSDDKMVQKERERIKRSQNLKEYVIKKNNFQCEISSEHQSFISERTKRNYVETHHIIPLSVQKYGVYDYKLDCEANLSCLCPNCHKLLHYGTWAEKEPLLRLLFNQHFKALLESNIDIGSIDSISFYYKD